MRCKNKPEGANWGLFGEDDQLGRPNVIRAEQVILSAREIVAGLSFCLSLPLNFPGGNTHSTCDAIHLFSVPRSRMGANSTGRCNISKFVDVKWGDRGAGARNKLGEANDAIAGQARCQSV